MAGPTNLGEGISAVAVYLSTAQMILIERVAAMIEALFGISVSTGWVSLALARAQAAVGPANEAIRQRISGSGTAFFDESMTTVGGRRAWFHAAATDTLTAYHADACGRGLEAMTAVGILDPFTGVAVHDAYAAYYSAALNQDGMTHALCIAHIQRELRGLADHDPVAAKDGWAGELDELIVNLFRWRDTLTGLQQFLTICGYLDTLRKNQRHIITDLRHALQGNARVPA